MIVSLINIVSGLFTLAGKIFEWLYARRMVDAGKVEQRLEDLSRQVRDAQVAIAAREAIRATLAADPDSLPDDDPFLRD